MNNWALRLHPNIDHILAHFYQNQNISIDCNPQELLDKF